MNKNNADELVLTPVPTPEPSDEPSPQRTIRCLGPKRIWTDRGPTSKLVTLHVESGNHHVMVPMLASVAAVVGQQIIDVATNDAAVIVAS